VDLEQLREVHVRQGEPPAVDRALIDLLEVQVEQAVREVPTLMVFLGYR
jgi:hypothetical protein